MKYSCKLPSSPAVTQPLGLILKIHQGEASDNSTFLFIMLKNPQLHYPLHCAVLGAEPSKSELGIRKKTEFKHKHNKKQQDEFDD